MTDAVVIVGLHRSNWERALEEPVGLEYWSLNQGHTLFPPELMARMTRWFQIHPWAAMARRQNPRLGHLEWLKRATIPVYLEEVHPEVPASVRYPYEAVCQTIGSNYFATNSFCYMVALAVHEGFRELRLHGLDLGPGDRSDGYARPALEFLLGFAASRGARVYVPEDSALLQADLYGRAVPVSSTALEIAIDTLIKAGGHLADSADVLLELQRQALRGQAAHRPPFTDGETEAYLDQAMSDIPDAPAAWGAGWTGVLGRIVAQFRGRHRDGR